MIKSDLLPDLFLFGIQDRYAATSVSSLFAELHHGSTHEQPAIDGARQSSKRSAKALRGLESNPTFISQTMCHLPVAAVSGLLLSLLVLLCNSQNALV